MYEVMRTPDGAALRYDLIRMLLPVAGLQVVALAREAEAFIVGPEPAQLAIDTETGKVEIVEPAVVAASQIGGEGVAEAPTEAEEAVTWWTADRLEELRRWWVAGKSYKEIATHLGSTVPAVRSKVSQSGLNKRWTRGARGKLLYTPIPLDGLSPELEQQLYPDDEAEPAAAEATRADEAEEDATLPAVEPAPAAARDVEPGESWAFTGHRTQAEVEPSAPAKPKRDYSVVVWTPERRRRLEELVRAAWEADEIAADLGLHVDQVNRWIPEQCLTGVWAEAKARKSGKSIEEPAPAPAREPLPEDRLKIVNDPGPAAEVDLDTVITWLRNNGNKVVELGGGKWRLNGITELSGAGLVTAANVRRRNLQLPPFAVRGGGRLNGHA